MPRVKVISIFFALAMFIQLGYYFDFIEFIESDENPLHNFKTHSFSSSPSLLPPLHALCSKTKWKPNVYINCSNISTNAFSAINQYQVCIRWAIDGGVNIIRPAFKYSDVDLEWKYPDYLLNEDYLFKSLAINCPSLKIVETSNLTEVQQIEGDIFFFGKRYRGKGAYNKYVQRKLFQNPPFPGTHPSRVIQERGSLGGWERTRDPPSIQTSFKQLFRFSPALTTLASRILSSLPPSFFAVHLRSTENEDSLKEVKEEGEVEVERVGEREGERDEIGEALKWVLERNTSARPVVYVSTEDGRTLDQFIKRSLLLSILPSHKLSPSPSSSFSSHSSFSRQDAEWMVMNLEEDEMRVIDHIVMMRANYYVGTGGSVDSYMLGQNRHFIQFGNLDYHGMDEQQYLLGDGVNWWSGTTW